eukprot:CAMPEP_0196577918 /NCGR_PEP_ID=MMETSP1081-20130531/6910_1 /TAXON_ID=36882 /ORGANISM="Pyramimonas amylifera, Strain CCMP720" /LENGTH=182 /DNA_ID=CAMNT_0041896981 /DNA_START=274 /DNA_END=822 /DNA_ORIENTATION=+
MAANLFETAQAEGCTQFANLVSSQPVVAAMLADESKSYTVFVPTDAAFAAASEASFAEAQKVGMENVLKYHMLVGRVKSNHLENYPKIMTCEGTKIDIDIRSIKGVTQVGAPPRGTQGLAGTVEGGKITKSDIQASNGTIHLIDGLMVPKAPLIGQNGGYVAGTEPGSGEGRTGLDTKVSAW